MNITGTLSALGVSRILLLKPGQTATVSLIVASEQTFNGSVGLGQSRDGATWQPVYDVNGVLLGYSGASVALTGTVVSTTIRNDSDFPIRYAWNCIVASTANAIAYTLNDVNGERVDAVLFDRAGRPLAWALDNGGLSFNGPESLRSTETLVTAAAARAVSLDSYETVLKTGGTAGAELVTIGDGTGAIIGQRKLIRVGTRTNGSDVPTLDYANIVNASGVQTTVVSLAAVGTFILLAWNGAKWQVIYGNGTITTA
jgi:hypothetical protein